MKKTICKREYNTETAERICSRSFGCYGDPAGYEQILYRTPEGLYFLYVRGGEASAYPNEDILRLAKTKVGAWLENR